LLAIVSVVIVTSVVYSGLDTNTSIDQNKFNMNRDIEESPIKVTSYSQLSALIGHNIIVSGEALNDNTYGGENDDPEDDTAYLVPVIEVHLIDDRNLPKSNTDDLDFVVRFRLEKDNLWTKEEEGNIFTFSGKCNSESILEKDSVGHIYIKEVIHFLNQPLKTIAN
jgi:hypothetical protein